MSLPDFARPKFSTKLPSTGETVTFRPFLVKEEKAMLMAAESDDVETQVRAIKDALIACVDNLDINKLPYFDIEFLFLNLRAKSVGEEVKYSYRHRGGVNLKNEPCDASTDVTINVDDIHVKFDSNQTTKLMFDHERGCVMKYPTIDDVIRLSRKEENETELLATCIESVFDASNIYPTTNIKETIAFVERLTSGEYEKLKKWFEAMPMLKYDITYKCKGCGQEDTIHFEGVSDFF